MDTYQATANPSGAKFQIFSGILKANRSSDGRMRLNGVASSTSRDLHGDTMMASALEDMERAANNNLTIFLNHSYNVPEDVAGSVESAKMKTRGVDGNGNPNYDLDMVILVNDANERAVQAFEAIERGTKLGLSIGALIPDGGARKEKGGAFLIDHVELLETSLVGIPANPRSWVEYAAKSLRGVEKATTVPLGQPTLTLDGNNWTVSGTIDSTTINTGLSTTVPSTGWLEVSDSYELDVTQEVSTNELIIESVEPDVADAYCPDCDGDDKCPKHAKSVEPDVADAAVTIIQIDTGDSSSSDATPPDASSSQDADSSNPGTGDGDFAAEGDDAIEVTAAIDDNALSMASVVERYAASVSELLEAKQIISTLTIERDAARRERDAALSDATKVVAETERVLNQLADAPLMRKAVVVAAQAALESRLAGIYSESVLKIMRGTND